jgi:hypothetical protein
VIGLTTASAVWVMVAVGVICGIGHPMVAVGVSAVVLLILELPSIPGLRLLDAGRHQGRFAEKATPDPDLGPGGEVPNT